MCRFDDLRFQAMTSLLLGRTHVSIALLLNEPVDNLRPKLQKIFDELTDDVKKLYYTTDDPEIAW
jgi:hypothetical protein